MSFLGVIAHIYSNYSAVKTISIFFFYAVD